ncbi:MAG: hypothetical protein LBL06_03965, partial [Treponema sp.]|nr:hypothetical protein [Treponema sp.]
IQLCLEPIQLCLEPIQLCLEPIQLCLKPIQFQQIVVSVRDERVSDTHRVDWGVAEDRLRRAGDRGAHHRVYCAPSSV